MISNPSPKGLVAEHRPTAKPEQPKNRSPVTRFARTNIGSLHLGQCRSTTDSPTSKSCAVIFLGGFGGMMDLAFGMVPTGNFLGSLGSGSSGTCPALKLRNVPLTWSLASSSINLTNLAVQFLRRTGSPWNNNCKRSTRSDFLPEVWIPHSSQSFWSSNTFIEARFDGRTCAKLTTSRVSILAWTTGRMISCVSLTERLWRAAWPTTDNGPASDGMGPELIRSHSESARLALGA